MNYLVGLVHYSRDPQVLYSEKNIKNGSHDTVHTFKNYFTIVFPVFSKISDIQTDPKSFNTIFKHPIRSEFDRSEII